MRRTRLFAVLAALAALAASPAPAAPGLLAGVVDDWTKWTNRADRFGDVYRQLGLDVVRVTVGWRPEQWAPDASTRKELDRTMRATEGCGSFSPSTDGRATLRTTLPSARPTARTSVRCSRAVHASATS